jgi:hypothetical protein
MLVRQVRRIAVGRCIFQVQAIESTAQNVMGADALQVAGARVCRGKQPGVFAGAVVQLLFVFEQAVAQLWMDRDVAVNSLLCFLPHHFQDVFGATVFGEDLRILDGDDFANAQAGINAQGEERLVAIVAEELKEIADFGLSKDSGLPRHVNKACF